MNIFLDEGYAKQFRKLFLLVSDLVKGKDMWKPVGNNWKAVTESNRE